MVFFKSAGVPLKILSPYYEKLESDRDSFRKHLVTRAILQEINEGGDLLLECRREVLKRVTEFMDFSTCYEDDRDKARARVASLRDLVNAKDIPTRIEIERQRERKIRMDKSAAEAEAKLKRQSEAENLKQRLYGLFPITDGQARGKALEPVLNDLFKFYGILVQESFTLRSVAGTAIEQLDGVIELDGNVYLVEMKWHSDPIGKESMAQHLVSVFNRGDGRGLFVSYSRFTEAAIVQCRDALSQRTFTLMRLEEIVKILECDGDLRDLLRNKVRAAIHSKNPLHTE